MTEQNTMAVVSDDSIEAGTAPAEVAEAGTVEQAEATVPAVEAEETPAPAEATAPVAEEVPAWKSEKWDIRNCQLRADALLVTTQNWNRVGDMLHVRLTKAEGGKCITKFKNDRTLDRAGLEAEFAAEVVKQEQGLARGRYFCVRCVIESKLVAQPKPKAEVKAPAAAAPAAAEKEVVDGVDLAQPFVSFEQDEAEQDAKDAADAAKLAELKAAAKPAPAKRTTRARTTRAKTASTAK